MFCGKTEELIRRLRRVTFAKQGVLLVKPAIDNRYSEDEVASHAGARMTAHPIKDGDPGRILDLWEEFDRPPNVGIDEGQFFSDLVPVLEHLIAAGCRVIVAGLDLDYRGRSFLDPEILSLAEDVTKLTAVCMKCGRPATKTQRLTGGTSQVEVGAVGQYEARCRFHWTAGPTG
jgi:thymidine kinase